MSHGTHVNEWGILYHSYVGSLKTYVSFAKEPYKSDEILQKRPIFFHMSHATHVNEWGILYHSYVGSLKTYVSFAKEPYKSDEILQKRPIFFHMSHGTQVNEWGICTIHMCDVAYSYVWHESMMCIAMIGHTCAYGNTHTHTHTRIHSHAHKTHTHTHTTIMS